MHTDGDKRWAMPTLRGFLGNVARGDYGLSTARHLKTNG
jgi:hypothetical protein